MSLPSRLFHLNIGFRKSPNEFPLWPFPPKHTAREQAMQMFLFQGIPLARALTYCAPHATKNEHPTTHYIWRTRGDGKVRSSHAANNGRIFSRDNPPTTGHPGEDYGCRCIAEPYYTERSEYAYQTVGNLTNTGSKWKIIDVIIHAYTGFGRGVTLREIGHLSGLVDYYLHNIVISGKNTRERLNDQIIAAAREKGEGSFGYSFRNSYEFRNYFYPFGDGVVQGGFSGSVKQAGGQLIINGTINYIYSDTMTNVVSLREELIDTSDPEAAYLLARYVTDGGAIYFDITDRWEASFEARVNIDPNASRFR